MWYKKPPAIIALLILFFPAGLFLMWKYAHWSKKTKWIVTGIVVFVLVMSNAGKSAQTTSTPQESTKTETKTPTKVTKDNSKHSLDATVKFNEDAFLITNNEDVDWSNCTLSLNSSGLFDGGYKFEIEAIISKDPLIVPFREFTKGDGTRFNANSTKPKSVSISCHVPNVGPGFNYFEMK